MFGSRNFLFAKGASAAQFKLFSWGSNNKGALGLNSAGNRSSPVQVGALTDWDTPTASRNFVLCTKTDGTLWGWGYNYQGQLGLNNLTYTFSSPVQVGSLTTWQLAGCGFNFGNAVKTNGQLWSWGVNATGQLGLNNLTDYSSPVQVGALTNWKTPARGASSYHALCVKTDGTLWAWGNGTNGRLGTSNSTTQSSPVQVGALTDWKIPCAGRAQSLCVKTDGTLWSWGRNLYGVLGLGNTTQYNSPKQIGANTDWATPTLSGNNSAACTTTDGKLFPWGRNNYGQLGLGDTVDRSSPVQVGALTNWETPSMGYSSMGCKKTDGTLWMWGRNATGQLGQGNTTNQSSPVQVGSLTNWNKLSVNGAAANEFVMCTTTS